MLITKIISIVLNVLDLNFYSRLLVYYFSEGLHSSIWCPVHALVFRKIMAWLLVLVLDLT